MLQHNFHDYIEVIRLQLLWLTAVSFTFIHLIRNAFIKYSVKQKICCHCNVYFNGHLDISASALASALQKIYICLQELFWKNRIFIFWFLIMTSVLLCCKYLFLYDLYSICTIQPFKGIHWCTRRRLFELSEASVYWYCDKIVAPKVSAYFPAKRPGWCSF